MTPKKKIILFLFYHLADCLGCLQDKLVKTAKKLKKNSTALENYRRIYVPPGVPLKKEKDEPLRVNVLFKHIQV